MDVVLMGISGAIALVLAVWTVLREDASTAGRGRHRGHLHARPAVVDARPPVIAH